MDNLQRLEAYRIANEECARIVVADPERYQGLMQEWAQLVPERAEKTERAA